MHHRRRHIHIHIKYRDENDGNDPRVCVCLLYLFICIELSIDSQYQDIVKENRKSLKQVADPRSLVHAWMIAHFLVFSNDVRWIIKSWNSCCSLAADDDDGSSDNRMNVRRGSNISLQLYPSGFYWTIRGLYCCWNLIFINPINLMKIEDDDDSNLRVSSNKITN